MRSEIREELANYLLNHCFVISGKSEEGPGALQGAVPERDPVSHER